VAHRHSDEVYELFKERDRAAAAVKDLEWEIERLRARCKDPEDELRLMRDTRWREIARRYNRVRGRPIPLKSGCRSIGITFGDRNHRGSIWLVLG
jgi:hypothetical protein